MLWCCTYATLQALLSSFEILIIKGREAAAAAAAEQMDERQNQYYNTESILSIQYKCIVKAESILQCMTENSSLSLPCELS